MTVMATLTPQSEMWLMFEYFDKDKSGDIDYDEFLRGLQNQGDRRWG